MNHWITSYKHWKFKNWIYWLRYNSQGRTNTTLLPLEIKWNTFPLNCPILPIQSRNKMFARETMEWSMSPHMSERCWMSTNENDSEYDWNEPRLKKCYFTQSCPHFQQKLTAQMEQWTQWKYFFHWLKVYFTMIAPTIFVNWNFAPWTWLINESNGNMWTMEEVFEISN